VEQPQDSPRELSASIDAGRHDKAKRIMDIVNRGDFPAVMEHVSKLIAAAQSSNSSAKDLSRIILKDLGLTNKVLKVANSAYYGLRFRGIRKISTVTGAVILLGFEAVRDITATITLFDYFSKKATDIRELKRMVALSFTGATFARELSRAINYSGEEEAYLCGLFHDFGRMIAAFMLPDEYRKIKKEIENGSSENKAAKAILGMSLRELGIAVAKMWSFSEKICKSMEGMPSATDGPPTESDTLRALAFMGHLISEAVYSGKNFEEEIGRIVSIYGKVLPINEDLIADVKEEAERRAMELMSPLGLDISVLKPRGGEYQPETAQPSDIQDEIDDLERRKECILNASLEITQSIVKECDLDSIYMIIMESMQHGLAFDHVILALVDPARTIIKARYGIGEEVENIIGKLVLPLRESSGIVASSVAWGKDMIVGPGDPNLSEGDKMILSDIKALSMAALPIMIDNQAIGNFVISKKNSRIDADSLRQAGKLRDYASLAIEATRNRMPKK
jgi:HD-like signal output (HDOD) protein